jgi:hypothetical protein
MSDRNKNRQRFGKTSFSHNQRNDQAHTAAQTAAQTTEQTTEQTTAEGNPAEVVIANAETELVFQGKPLRKSNILLLALSQPKADEKGFSVQEMEFRETLREKMRQANGELRFLENEHRYLKGLLQVVAFPFESKVLIDFAKNF